MKYKSLDELMEWWAISLFFGFWIFVLIDIYPPWLQSVVSTGFIFGILAPSVVYPLVVIPQLGQWSRDYRYTAMILSIVSVFCGASWLLLVVNYSLGLNLATVAKGPVITYSIFSKIILFLCALLPLLVLKLVKPRHEETYQGKEKEVLQDIVLMGGIPCVAWSICFIEFITFLGVVKLAVAVVIVWVGYETYDVFKTWKKELMNFWENIWVGGFLVLWSMGVLMIFNSLNKEFNLNLPHVTYHYVCNMVSGYSYLTYSSMGVKIFLVVMFILPTVVAFLKKIRR